MEDNKKSELSEPAAMYAVRPKQHCRTSKPIRKEFDECFEKYKAEADEIYGKKSRMTVEEYFGKLRYIVDRYYDSVQGQD